MRRILHIIDSLSRTGTATQMLVLADGLARQEFEVHICALNGAAGKISIPFKEGLGEGSSSTTSAIPVTGLGRRWSIDPLADWRLRRLVARLRPDIVHTWDSVAGMLGPIALGGWGRASGEPPGRCHLIAGHYRMRRYPPAWDAFIERRFASHVASFVTNSPTVRDCCVRRGMPAEKFMVIPSGVPCAKGSITCATGSASALSADTGRASGTHADRASDVTRDELLRELRLPADARLIGVVGRLVPEKRVQDLIWAADLLRVLHNNLRLVIIGDGPERRQLQRYAQLASDLEHIQFLGERDDVWRIMPHLGVLWNGSENRGQSMAILEAMAAGVPVIASDTACNRELVVEGETGFLIPLGSRAGRAARARHTDLLFTDAEFAARLAAGSRRRIAEHFSAERMVQQYAELYSVFCA